MKHLCSLPVFNVMAALCFLPAFLHTAFLYADKTADALLEEQARKGFAWFCKYREETTGLILDRGPNSLEADNRTTLSSIAACGYHLSFLPQAVRLGWVEKEEARRQTRTLLTFVWEHFEHDRGFFCRFYELRSGKPVPEGEFHVLDTAVFLNGAIVAAVYFGGEINNLADQLLDRVEWTTVVMPTSDNRPVLATMIKDGKARDPMDERSSGALMAYMLAIGSKTHSIDPELWYNTRCLSGRVGRFDVLNPRTPLFFSHCSLAWQDLTDFQDRDGIDWEEKAKTAAQANREYCRLLGGKFQTYHIANGGWWGITSGDAPGGHVEQCLDETVDGTVWPLGALATVTWIPETVRADIVAWNKSASWKKVNGPYGLSPFNQDQEWIGSDLIAVDVGRFLLSWANWKEKTIKDLWRKHPVAQNAEKRLHFEKRRPVK